MWGGVPGFNEEETPPKKSQAIRKELCYFCVGRGYIVLGAADLQTGRYIRWGCCFKNRYDSRGPSGLSSHSASAAYCPLAVACCCCCSLFRVGLTDYDDCASSLFFIFGPFRMERVSPGTRSTCALFLGCRREGFFSRL